MAVNNILVPVDFSPCSLDAFRSTMALAKAIGSQIHILHASGLPEGWEKWPAREKDQNPFLQDKEKTIVSGLMDLQKICEEEDVPSDIEWTTRSVGASVEASIKNHNIDLVVMGSHGASGKQEYFIGSNAQKVLRQIRVPLLVLKSELKAPVEFKKGLFASALFQQDKDAMHEFIRFAQLFGLEEVHIVAVDTAGYFSQPPIVMREAIKDFAESIEGLIVKTHFGKASSVESGIRHYSEEENIDLIAISNKEKSPLKRMLVGSNVEMLINHSQVPVLTMDWKD